MLRPDEISDEEDVARNELRERLNKQFLKGRRPNNTQASSYVFDMASELMKRSELFDATKYSKRDVERYGEHDLGRHMLVGRKMLEAGVRFVKVNSYGWDTHGDNFQRALINGPPIRPSV